MRRVRKGGGAFSVVLLGACFCSLTARTQARATGSAIVTAIPKDSEDLTMVPKQAVTLSVNGKVRQISRWVSLQGPDDEMQIAVLIDDSAISSLSLQLQDLRNFIGVLPPSARVAVAYMRAGSAVMAQNFTTDHDAAANAVRVPGEVTGGNGSPYFCLQDLVKHWPSGGHARREVVMVTSGIDPYEGRRFNPQNPYLASAIQNAQRARVLVYSIYYRDQEMENRGFSVAAGQSYLTQLSDATGGEVYYIGLGNPVSFQPFLKDIWGKLQNQYELTFDAPPQKGLVRIKVKTSQPDTKLVAPSAVSLFASSQ